MRRRLIALMLLIFVIGCSKNIKINIDGMPVSNHEYSAQDKNTGIRVVFILARYYRRYEGKEYLTLPEYLDSFKENRIQPDDTDALILHIKVINLGNAYYSMKWQISEQKAGQLASGVSYSGKLSRKDFTVKLPFLKPGRYQYSFALLDENDRDIFGIPEMGYSVKGGENYKAIH